MFRDSRHTSEALERESEKVLFQVYDWITDEVCAEREIEKRIRNQTPQQFVSYPSLCLNKELILSESQIKAFCVNLRLRFLDANHFAGEIPVEALCKVKELERETGKRVELFKIIAPAKAFKLSKCKDDPFLLAALGNGRYFLIHQWGKPLPWWRQVVYFPLRNNISLWMSITLIATFLVWSIPVKSFLLEQNVGNEWAVASLYLWFGICATYILGLISVSAIKGTNDKEWNNPFQESKSF